MERNRVILTDRERQQQQQQERERQEQCNAEQAVTKHFEESLRRAKEKQMRAAWTINTIPASQQQQQQQQPSNLQPYYTSNQKVPAPTAVTAPKILDEYTANEISVKRIFWPQNPSTSYFNYKVTNNEQIQPSRHSLQIISRTQKPEYQPPPQQPHREIIAQSTKILPDKRHIIKNESVQSNRMPLFNECNYSNAMQYKDLKFNKAEVSLSNPPSSNNQQSVGVIVKHDTSLKINPIQLTHSNVEKIQPHSTIASQAQAKPHQVLHFKKVPEVSPPNIAQKMPIYSHEQYVQPFQHHTVQLQLAQQTQKPAFSSFHPTITFISNLYTNMTQQAPPFLNAQIKPKVSSPAPPKIYGRPGNLSTDPIKPDLGRANQIGNVNQSQDRILTEPPAHSHGRNYLLPQQPVHFDLPVAAPAPTAHSPGIHMQSPATPNTIPITAPTIVQSKPLDLGISERYRNNASCSPRLTPPNEPIALDVTKAATTLISVKCFSSGTTDSEHPSTNVVQDSMKVPTITMTPGTEAVASPQTHPSASTRSHEIDDTTNSSNNSKCDNDKSSTDLVANGTANDANQNVLTATINQPSSNESKNPLRTNSADGFLRSSSTNSSPVPSPNSAQSAPATPSKCSNDYERQSSPAVAPRHLKKAWLQRHTTGEDGENSSTTSTSNATAVANETINVANTANKTNCPDSDNSGKDSTKSASVHSVNMSSSPPNNTSRRAGSPVTRAKRNKFDLDKQNDSSSSDQSSTQKSVQKRKIPKGKRRKIGYKQKNQTSSVGGSGAGEGSESDRESGESDKESMSDKDSDSTGTFQPKQVLNGATGNGNDANENKDKDKDKELRKRGRRPKDSNENIAKKRKPLNAKDPFRKPPLSQLKKTGESFLQDGPCFNVAPKLAKCRECRWTANQRSKNTSNIFCRFYAFRKLRYTKTGQLAISGFCDPHKDPTEEDLKLWMPDADNPPTDLELAQARFLLAKVADQFCDLFVQEKMAMPENMAGNKTIAWKRVMQGVREMCDVCETSLFNYHWACSKCGFVVCIDCYKARKYGENKIWNNEWNNDSDRDDYQWLLCTNRASHDQERLMLTQIIAGDSLQVLGRRIHHVRALWKIPQNCACLMSREEPPKATNGICKELIESILNDNHLNRSDKMDFSSSDSESNVKKETSDSKTALNILAQVALKAEDIKKESTEKPTNECVANKTETKSSDLTEPKFDDNDDDNSSEGSSLDDNHSTLRDLLIGPITKSTANSPSESQTEKETEEKATSESKPMVKTPKKSHQQLFDEMMADTLEPAKKREENEDLISNQPRRNRYLPIRIMTMALSQELYPNVQHQWLCEGKLLRLLDPMDANNLKIFQQQWKRGQPVMVSHVDKCLNMDLWRPESFSRDFGEDANDLVNCLTGTLVPNQPMKRFWDGFDYINKRIKDNKGDPILLKLKDWPPGEDFAETLPTRFTDLMKSLPLSDYTKRNGKFNLASRLPECFVKPDLGPKMYNAYGSASHPTKGTTNLHLDISDAVNVMVYVGIPKDTGNNDAEIREAYRAIDEAGCDILQRRRVREKNELPGALWHIFSPRDANKIRDLLNKVAIERGERLEPSHDAIHDQSWYLDGKLRERLYKEYGVEGYPIAQCLGDAVFIPAGAPHQVRNLLNCIKVAEDFVSPENVSECFHLTHEFRALTDTHSNHEDKLQIKNIIYHAVKDALSVLSHVLGERIAKEQGCDIKQEQECDIKQQEDEPMDTESKGNSGTE